MRRIDHLEIAITKSAFALLSPVVREFVWGPEQNPLLFLKGHVLGRLAASRWSTKPQLAAASSDLTIVSLWPMLELPTNIEPAIADLGRLLFPVLSASNVWIVWYERDFDQHSISESTMDASEASEHVQQCVESLSNTNFIIYSASFAQRLLPSW